MKNKPNALYDAQFMSFSDPRKYLFFIFHSIIYVSVDYLMFDHFFPILMQSPAKTNEKKSLKINDGLVRKF